MQQLAILALFLLSMGIAYPMASRLTRPLQDITQVAGRIEQKDWSARVHAKGNDEISHLANALDIMADAICKNKAGLEEEVRNRTLELSTRNKSLEQFALTASHDLRAPLRGIRLLANLLAEGNADKAEFHKLIRQVDKMDELTKDILEYYTAGSHSARLQQHVDVNNLVKNVIETLTPPEGFQIQISRPLPAFTTLRAPLKMIFHNLIDNAIKHHDSPGEGEVQVNYAEKGGQYEFSIVDNGPGLPESMLETALIPFHKGLHPHGMEGSGLGLSTVQQILKQAGGEVRISPAGGRGLCVHFTWPMRFVGYKSLEGTI